MSPTITSLPTHPIVPSSADVSPAARCEVCGHPSAHHDAVANRYCNATLANALTRGCICPTPAS